MYKVESSGLICKKMGKLEEALDCFYKLHNMLRNNVQVLCQLGSMYVLKHLIKYI